MKRAILSYDLCSRLFFVRCLVLGGLDSNGQNYVHGGTDLGATTFFADLAILGKE